MKANEMLKPAEIGKMKEMGERIKKAMAEKTNYTSVTELNVAIAKDRNGRCPDKSLYTKISNPPREGQEYYNISAQNLIVLADALDVSVDYLLGRTEIMNPVNDIEVNTLGLTDKSVEKLKDIHDKAKNYKNKHKGFEPMSAYSRNPYEMVLEALNMIIGHTSNDEENVDGASYDFLSTIYQFVVLHLNDPGAAIAWILSDAESVTEESCSREKYKDAISDENANTTDLSSVRKWAILNEPADEIKRKAIRELKNGIITLTDPVTNDEVKVNLTAPSKSLEERIISILEQWRKEYDAVYQKRHNNLNDEESEWLKTIMPMSMEEIKGKGEIPNDKNTPNKLLYRDPFLSELNESQMKRYLAFLKLEKYGKGGFYIDADGDVISLSDGLPAFIDKSEPLDEEMIKTGFTVKGNVLFFDENLAEDSRSRCKELFERSGLITSLKKYMKAHVKGMNEMIFNGFYNEKDIMYSKEEAQQVINEARTKGIHYRVDGSELHVWTEEKPES